MPQLYARSRTGPRTPLLAPHVRSTRSQVQIEDTISDVESSGSNTPPYVPRPGTRRSRRQDTTQMVDESSEAQSQDDADDDKDEDSDEDDDSDEPAVFAPSRSDIQIGAGHFVAPSSRTMKDVVADEMFDDAEDDSDDDVPGRYSYKQLDEADDDDDDDEEEEENNQFVLNDEEFKIEAEHDYDDWMNRVEGLSAYGFGEGDIGVLSSSSSEEFEGFSPPDVRRHVHFHPEPMFSTDLTATVAPALLPSALPDADDFTPALVIHSDISQVVAPFGASSHLQTGNEMIHDDPYDSDATVESLPPEAYTTDPRSMNVAAIEPNARGRDANSEPRSSRNGHRSRRGKSPPSGFFEVDTSKPYAIFNKAEKHLEVFVPSSGPNRPEWLSKEMLPSEDGSEDGRDDVSLSHLVDESVSSQSSGRDSTERAMNDFDSPTSSQTLGANANSASIEAPGFGLPESVFAPASFLVGDFLLDTGDLDLGSSFDPDDEGDLPGDLSNFIAFDDDSESDTEAFPAFRPSSQPMFAVNSTPTNTFAQLNSTNVTSFRRNADPSVYAMSSTPFRPTVPAIQIPQNPFLQTPRQGHKRKTSDSPYSSPVYKGNTPAPRVIRTSKRRKMTT